MMTASDRTRDCEVLIAGAGPVGLMLACRLGALGVRCLLVERRTHPPRHSRAIGVMPPTLAKLQALGLADAVVAAGCRVPRAVVHDASRELGAVDFAALPPPFPFVLSIPQDDFMRVLQEAVVAQACVEQRNGEEVTGLVQDAGGVTAEITEEGGGTVRTVRAAFLAACDGASGELRELLDVDRPARRYAPSFLMGDYEDRTDWGATAHLFFTPHGSVESFPLPHRRRRWVVLADPAVPERTAAELRRRIRALAGIALPAADELWHSDFTPERRLNRHYVRGRAACCGDSAHVMSPIGGQGMNTGLADAWHLADALEQTLRHGRPHAPLLAHYESVRRRAFRCAAHRAACGMWLGTRTGAAASALRSWVIRRVLFGTPLRHRLAPFFSMLTIPEEPGPADSATPAGERAS